MKKYFIRKKASKKYAEWIKTMCGHAVIMHGERIEVDHLMKYFKKLEQNTKHI